MKKIHCFQLVLMLFLVITLPFTASFSLAATITIERNEGLNRVDGFLSGRGDIWDVAVKIEGEQNVDTSRVTINTFKFDECAPDGTGARCIYAFDFLDKKIVESQYDVEVLLIDEVGNVVAEQQSQVIVDASAPLLEGLNVEQRESGVFLTLAVRDAPALCSGVSKLQFFDGVTLLKETSVAVGCELSQMSETLNIPFQGTGIKTLRIVAHDKVGNQAVVFSPGIFVDNTIPRILEETFEGVGSFIGTGGIVTDLSIDVEEDGGNITVTGTSAELNMDTVEATCEREGQVFHCTWPQRRISGSFTFRVEAFDGKNRVSRTIAKPLSVDSTRPAALGIQTIRTHNNQSFVAQEANSFVVFIAEQESGISPENVAIDFSELGTGLRRVTADSCTDEAVVSCFFNGIPAVQGGTVYLTELRDNAGNAGTTLPSVAVTADFEKPIIRDLKITPVLGVEGAKRTALQSRDLVRIEFRIDEENGYTADVDLSGLVENGEIVPAECDARCFVVTSEIKSGFIEKAPLHIFVQDTAGNKVHGYKELTVFAIDDETKPEFWEVGTPEVSPPFIDAEAAQLVPMRIFYSIPVTTQAQDVSLLSFSLKGCTVQPHNSTISANFVKNFFTSHSVGSTTPYLVVELERTNAITSFDMQCQFDLFSRRGQQIMRNSESESINVTAVVQQSGFGAVTEEVEKALDDSRDKVEGGLFKIIGTLKKIISFLEIACNLIRTIMNTFTLVKAFTGTALQPLYVTPAVPEAQAACLSVANSLQVTEVTGIPIFDKFCNILSCRWTSLLGDPENNPGVMNSVLSFADQFEFYGSLGFAIPTVDEIRTRSGFIDPERTLISSVMHLCPKGIVYNLDKLRQIECRYMLCLKNDVKDGVATLQACRELKDYEECKYIWGEIFQLIPFVALLDGLIKRVLQIITDPIGIVFLLLKSLCPQFCFTTSAGWSGCSIAALAEYVLKLAQDFIAIKDGFSSMKGDACAEALEDEEGSGGGLGGLLG